MIVKTSCMTFLLEFLIFSTSSLTGFSNSLNLQFQGRLVGQSKATAERRNIGKKRKKKSATKMWAGALRCVVRLRMNSRAAHGGGDIEQVGAAALGGAAGASAASENGGLVPMKWRITAAGTTTTKLATIHSTWGGGVSLTLYTLASMPLSQTHAQTHTHLRT